MAADPTPPTVRASARYVRVAPRKARLVADQVRGLPVEDAQTLLRFSPRGASRDIAKLLDSAAANAENNHDLVAEDMRVATITVDEGPTIKRWRARARGRATRIDKRTSHISLALQPTEEDAVDMVGTVAPHDLQFDQAAAGRQRHQERPRHDVTDQAVDAAHADLSKAAVSNNGRPTTLL